MNGDIVIYDTDDGSNAVTEGAITNTGQTKGKLTLISVISCRSKRGKFSTGRKVTGIEFLSFNIAMITTNDSRIRFIDIRVININITNSYYIEWRDHI